MSNKIKTPILDESYQECVECLIDDFNDLTVYGQCEEIPKFLVEKRKEEMGRLLINLHNRNVEWVNEKLKDKYLGTIKR